jgi:hypothetical protein
MFGCSVNLWETEDFLKILGPTGGLHRSLRFFLKLLAAMIFQIFTGSYVKIHRQQVSGGLLRSSRSFF